MLHRFFEYLNIKKDTLFDGQAICFHLQQAIPKDIQWPKRQNPHYKRHPKKGGKIQYIAWASCHEITSIKARNRSLWQLLKRIAPHLRLRTTGSDDLHQPQIQYVDQDIWGWGDLGGPAAWEKGCYWKWIREAEGCD